MTDAILTVLLWFSAIGCGMMAGIYFAFSTFIMRALASIPQASGAGGMQAINRVILKSSFIPLFMGTTLACVVLAGLALLRLGERGAAAVLAGGVVYVIGMFVCTMLLNVPLNNALDAVDAASPEATPVWTRYLKDWVRWNHVRTIASAVACALFIAALITLPGCAQPANDEAGVRAAFESFYGAMKTGDTAAAMAVVADDAVFVEGGRLETRDEYEKNHLPADIGFEKQVSGKRGPLKITFQGDTAWVIATTDYDGTFDGAPVSFTSAQLAILSRESGSWRIRSIHWSSRRR